ncbi:sugar phosphate isomerase/epimerase family protein [Paenibacillus sp. KN14-4R]|uniref:sugar phosphate isomerase/epimerase family protein n=1 Tax=Paenibacillus sp. KN14-4R TaxID=3445773 RepID=UPI003F9F2A9E
MNISLCTISFRHELLCFSDIIRFAELNGINGIELWGVHAKNLYSKLESTIKLLKQMGKCNINITMISEYLDFNENIDILISKCKEIVNYSKFFGTNKIRIFFGNSQSEGIKQIEWINAIEKLKKIVELFSKKGIYVLIETHPNTYADTLISTKRMCEEVQNEYLKVNLDYLHLWETGVFPVEAYYQLQPWIANYHLKNILAIEYSNVFEPANIYSPNGTRLGMTSLRNGAIQYEEVIRLMLNNENNSYIGIEWFGDDPINYLIEEKKWISALKPLVRV